MTSATVMDARAPDSVIQRFAAGASPPDDLGVILSGGNVDLGRLLFDTKAAS